MKHLGNITKINGTEIDPVDIITFGSPCQDLSIAGKRAGIQDGQRSNLFFEAVRIIKEMRKATNGEYPKYAVWENVPGAFSSNKGFDFHSVLETLCSVCDSTVSIPEPYDAKRTQLVWNKSGEIVGDNYSIAWRTFDAQYWGVPQRRKRIYLVADFGGQCAGEILFESEGLSGYTPQGFRAGQGTACGASAGTESAGVGFDGYNGCLTEDKSSTLGVNCGMSTGRNGVVLNDQGGNRMDVTDDVTSTLRAEAHHPPCIMESAGFCTEHSAQAHSIGYEEEMSPTLRAGVVPATVYENHGQDTRFTDAGDVAPMVLSTYDTGGNNQPFVVGTPKTLKIRSGCEGGGKGALIQDDKSATLGCNNDQTLFEPKAWDGSDVSPTLTANNAGGNQRMPDKDNFNCVVEAYGICSKDSNSMKSDNPHSGFYKADSSRCLDGNGGNPTCNQGGIAVVEGIPFTQNQRDEVRILGYKSGALCRAATKQQTYVLQGSMIGRKDENGPQGDGVNEDVSFTLNTSDRHAVYAMTAGSFANIGEEQSPTLLARDYKDPTFIAEPCYGIGRDAFNQGKNAQYKPSVEEELQPTLVAKGPGAVAKSEPEYTVRRLTPTECARLQGFPDWWGKLAPYNPEDDEFWEEVRKTHAEITGKKYKPLKNLKGWYEKLHTDGAEYKMWGNGIALPNAEYVIHGIAEQGAKTLGSLFDGSGGFPLAGAINGIKPLWSSEVEPYPIAVTKSRFGGYKS